MTDAGKTVSGVAERYAAALFELADEAGALDTVETELNAFSALLGQSEDLTRLVRSPVFTSDEQTRAVSAVLDAARLSGLGANMIKVAARNRRLFAVPDMIVGFRQMLARRRGEMSATVTSAEPLSAANVAAVKEALKAATGKDVSLEEKVDPALIGGLVVQVGSRMIDTSLRTKLGALRHAMKEAG
ncbi:MAG: F0F1 ATP synthase subunit delta [Bauldia sp.]|nr:F0F1 ATP synthase subunit delta [Bauldia sp.]